MSAEAVPVLVLPANPKRRVGMVEEIPISAIRVDYYVRRTTNEDRIIQFADALESGAHVKPIQVSIKSVSLRVGRHRLEAHLLLDRTRIQVEWVAELERPEALIEAFKENLGGSLPPTRSDIYFVIEQLLALEVPRRDIIAKLGLPKAVAVQYLDHVQSNIAKNRLNQAKLAVTDGGMTVPQAATAFNVEVDTLKSALRGRRKATNRAKQKLADIKRDLSNRFKGFSNRTAVVTKKVIVGMEDGIIDPAVVRGTIKHIDHLLKSSARSFEGWKKRAEEALKANQTNITRKASGSVDEEEEEE